MTVRLITAVTGGRGSINNCPVDIIVDREVVGLWHAQP